MAEIETAIAAGCNIVSGLHVFLNEDEHWRTFAADHEVRLCDVRNPDRDKFRVADGSIDANVALTLVPQSEPDNDRRTLQINKASASGLAPEGEDLSVATVAAISTWGEPKSQQEQHGLPTVNVYNEGEPKHLLDAVTEVLE